MNLAVNTLDNQSGAVRTDENLLLGVSQTLNNQNGLISSTGDLTISDRDTAQRRQSVNNLDGTLIAGKLLSLNAAYYSGTGRALSLGDLNFSLQSGLDLSGQIQANNNVDLNTAGALNNTGRLLAGNALQVNAQTLDNSANAEISAGQVRLNIADTLTNRGLIDGQQVRVQAATLNNLGTARLYGDQLAIATSTLNNLDENGVAATVAARESLNIGTGTLNNREESLIFSAGDLAIGSALSALDTAQDRAQLLTNASATVEALGNLSLNVQSVRNTNEHFSTRDVEVSRTPEQEFQLTGSTNRYQANEISLRNDEVNYLVTPEGQRDNWNRYDYTRVVNETQIATSAPAQILSGGTMQISAGDVLNDKSRISRRRAVAGRRDQPDQHRTVGRAHDRRQRHCYQLLPHAAQGPRPAGIEHSSLHPCPVDPGNLPATDRLRAKLGSQRHRHPDQRARHSGGRPADRGHRHRQRTRGATRRGRADSHWRSVP